jgi:hypothetical protein
MLRLKPRRRTVLVETFRELANLAAAALVLARFAGEQPLSTALVIGGAITWLLLVSLAFWIAGDNGDD